MTQVGSIIAICLVSICAFGCSAFPRHGDDWTRELPVSFTSQGRAQALVQRETVLMRRIYPAGYTAQCAFVDQIVSIDIYLPEYDNMLELARQVVESRPDASSPEREYYRTGGSTSLSGCHEMWLFHSSDITWIHHTDRSILHEFDKTEIPPFPSDAAITAELRRLAVAFDLAGTF